MNNLAQICNSIKFYTQGTSSQLPYTASWKIIALSVSGVAFILFSNFTYAVVPPLLTCTAVLIGITLIVNSINKFRQNREIYNGVQCIGNIIKQFSDPMEALLAMKAPKEYKAKKFIEICLSDNSIFKGKVIDGYAEMSTFFNNTLEKFKFSPETVAEINKTVKQYPLV